MVAWILVRMVLHGRDTLHRDYPMHDQLCYNKVLSCNRPLPIGQNIDRLPFSWNRVQRGSLSHSCYQWNHKHRHTCLDLYIYHHFYIQPYHQTLIHKLVDHSGDQSILLYTGIHHLYNGHRGDRLQDIWILHFGITIKNFKKILAIRISLNPNLPQTESKTGDPKLHELDLHHYKIF